MEGCGPGAELGRFCHGELRNLQLARRIFPRKTVGPADIRAISTVSTFKQHLKTHLFNIAYFY